MHTINFKNSNSRYPLSTDTLEFMQQQIHLAYGLASLYGENYIIRQSTASADGLIVIKGELMPLFGTPQNYIAVRQRSTKIEAAGLTFADARIERGATYTNFALGTYYRTTDFPVMQPIADHLVPKGVINMWSGSLSDIPYGWALCDGTNGTPDLRGRFIVGYNPNDTDYNAIGKTGGAKLVTLTTSQMPSHSHGGTLTSSSNGNHVHSVNDYYFSESNNQVSGVNGREMLNSNTIGSNSTDYDNKFLYYKTHNTNSNGSHTHSVTLTSQGNNQPHENRPPYYTLAYIMKIISPQDVSSEKSAKVYKVYKV